MVQVRPVQPHHGGGGDGGGREHLGRCHRLQAALHNLVLESREQRLK